MSFRRTIAHTVTIALIAFGLIAIPAATTVSAATETAQLPTDNPANFTPNVIDGEVDSIWQVGNTMIIGGTFTQVANSSSNGGQIYSRTYLAAFDATTGLIDPNFAPVLSSYVTTVIPTGDGTSIYVGGDFNTVNGVNRRKVARVNMSDGALVTTFNATGFNGVVRDLRLSAGQLYASGLFTTAGGQPRTNLASLNPTTGALTTKINVAVAGMHNGGATNVIKIEITPAGDRLLMIGNFTSVGGQTRDQIAMLDLTTDPVTVTSWYTTWYQARCSNSFDSYMRDLDISEDGKFAIVTTTGAYKANASCDTDTRLEINTLSSTVAPTWVNYTGGDTSYAVQIHNGVAFIGGHMRWGNNPSASDNWGQGAVPRQGMMALDVVTGLPFSWNPGRDRGVGLFDYFVSDAGVWAGSDTDRWNNELRQKLAFFPWAGGSLVPSNEIGTLPNNVFTLGRTAGTTGTDSSVLYRINAGGAALASADDGPDWASDNSSTSPFHNTGTSAASYTLTAAMTDSTVPNTDFDRPPAGLFNTERWDAATGSEMLWTFPVPAGTQIQVRLYMANKSTGTDEVGQRIFDIDLEGVNVVDNIDLAVTPGHNIATMRSFNITSDGSVSILFRHGVENPLINGIEIIRTDVSAVGTVGQQDEVQRRSYDGVGAAGVATVLPGTAPWRTIRGAFMVNHTLFTLHNDGTMMRRSFDGTTFGAGTATPTYANGILSEIPTMTGIFFDPATSRIYYTLSGQSSLFYRSFLPESNVIGAIRSVATGDIASLNPTRVRGMFLANGQLWFADSTAGALMKIGFANGVVAGTATVADASTNWTGRAMFLVNVAQPNVVPTAAFTSLCSVNSCQFDASTSTDTDGTITGYSWNFGDTQVGAGVNPAHSYAAGGTYTVTLTVTDSDGGTAVTQHDVTVTDPPNVAPTASFTSVCTLLSCTFNAAGSSDSDGTIAGYAWNFGDTLTGTGVNPTHGYAAGGTYTVTLTVADDDGATATTSAPVTIVDASNAAVFRASASANTSGAAGSIVVPAAVQPGDQLVLIITANANTTASTPAGWTLLGTRADGTPDMTSWVFTSTAVAGTAGSTVTSTLGAAGTKSSRVLMAYSNSQVPTVIASSVMGASSTALATPAVPVANTGSAVINYWSDKSASNTGWAQPATVVERATSIGTATGHITAEAADAIVTAASWPGATANSTVAGTKGIGWSIVMPAIAAPPPNVAPTASFTSSCSSLTCSFDATASSDSDGTIASYAWNFGDTLVGTGVTTSHTFAADGTYNVSLTVTDDDGAPNAIVAPVTVALLNANIGFRAASSANTSGTNASVVVPAAVQPGDQLVLFVTANVATTLTTPGGWTLLGTQDDGTPDVRSWVFTRTAVAGTAGSTVAATLGVTGKSTRLLVAYSGADAVSVLAASVMGASSTALASPAVTVAEHGSIVVGYWVDKSAGNTGWTLPVELTSRQSSLGAGSGQATAAAGDVAVAAGTYPGATANSSVAGQKGVAWSVVVSPA